ncbi:DUF4489 domain-containing protein, partial [Clostridium sp. ZBS13]|uniref:DUF4489 domain-containing protein n=1 Tax=Clostridium sp. ZBS13 TaxID=2949971 RepID=UPI002079A8AF
MKNRNLLKKANLKDDYENRNKRGDSCGQKLKGGEVGQALLFKVKSIETSVPAATITIDTSKFCDQCIRFE